MRNFTDADTVYHNYITKVDDFHEGAADIIHNFPAFVGSVNIARFLSLYEIYKNVVGLSGHIADIGTYKGASLMYFAKLVTLFEPYTQTEVHGFDWFQGMKPSEEDDQHSTGKYKGSFEQLNELIKLQGLSEFTFLQNLNLTEDLPGFFDDRPWMRFKCVFLDCGIKDVMQASLEHFWPRLVPGGVLILDHYNCNGSPFESGIVDSFIEGAPVQQIEFSRSPTAYVIKP